MNLLGKVYVTSYKHKNSSPFEEHDKRIPILNRIPIVQKQQKNGSEDNWQKTKIDIY
jgi:hypothetical protein